MLGGLEGRVEGWVEEGQGGGWAGLWWRGAPKRKTHTVIEFNKGFKKCVSSELSVKPQILGVSEFTGGAGGGGGGAAGGGGG